MKSPWIFAAGAAILFVSAPAFAASGHGHGRHGGHGGPGGGGHRGGMAMHLLHAADANDDRSVTRAEVDDLQNEMFDWLDRNADGVLNAEDRSPMARRMAAIHAARRADADDAGDGEHRRHMGRRGGRHNGWAHLDQNDDDTVTRDEFTSHATTMFGELDADSDGVITPDEIDAKMEERRRDHRWWRED